MSALREAAYWQELWRERRPLSAAALGTGFSISLNMFIASVFVPAMQVEFGWTGSQVSIAGTFGLIGLFTFPLAGRLADRFGSRRVMLGGVAAIPGCYLLYSLQTGALWQFFAIQVLWSLFAVLWSATVLGRIAAGRLTLARGFGIALLLSAPAATGAIAAPLLTELMDSEGWRHGYRVLAGVSLAAGLLSAALLPPPGSKHAAPLDQRPDREALRAIFRSRAFQILAVAMLLCNLGTIITGLQFAPMLIDRGTDPANVGGYLSAYAISVIVGRFAIGLSLDRYPTRFVAALGMGFPALGFALIAGSGLASWAMLAGVALLGISQGAEGDIAGYVGAQYLGPGLFSTTFGFVTAATSLAGFIGSVTSGVVLDQGGGFGPFLVFLAITTAAGAALFLFLPPTPVRRPPAPQPSTGSK
jgi:MFS family permease